MRFVNKNMPNPGAGVRRVWAIGGFMHEVKPNTREARYGSVGSESTRLNQTEDGRLVEAESVGVYLRLNQSGMHETERNRRGRGRGK